MCVYVFMHLVAVQNKAGRLTGHIASNQKSEGESDRERGPKEGGFGFKWRPNTMRLKHLAWNGAIIQ